MANKRQTFCDNLENRMSHFVAPEGVEDEEEPAEDDEDLFGGLAKTENQLAAEREPTQIYVKNVAKINNLSYFFQDETSPYKENVTVVEGVEKSNLMGKLLSKKDKVEDKYMLGGTSKHVMIPIDKTYYDQARLVKYTY